MTDFQEHEVVQIDWSNETGRVTITPKDQDRYTLKVHQAIERLEIGGRVSRLEAELKVLYGRLAKWLVDQDSVRQAFVTLRDGGFIFVVVRSVAEYDEEFEDSLSDLDIAIARDRDLSIKLDVLSLPAVSPESLETFITDDFVVSLPTFRPQPEPAKEANAV
ncbi:MAG: hypothetical protein WD030_10855 [Pirellulales bacterium]